ncbi:transposase [Bradyrhizobium sp. 145]|uniref:IS4/Tn5 family transposase DNA-binding protein n=1 Tax=Bradyrhizobium sp. 145 TaxID=2782621 RepID=UPI001FF74B84
MRYLVGRRPDGHQDDRDESAVAHWTEREIDKTAFKDARLGQRFGELLRQIGDGMGGSIPFACQDWANTKADRAGPANLNRRISGVSA